MASQTQAKKKVKGTRIALGNLHEPVAGVRERLQKSLNDVTARKKAGVAEKNEQLQTLAKQVQSTKAQVKLVASDGGASLAKREQTVSLRPFDRESAEKERKSQAIIVRQKRFVDAAARAGRRVQKVEMMRTNAWEKGEQLVSSTKTELAGGPVWQCKGVAKETKEKKEATKEMETKKRDDDIIWFFPGDPIEIRLTQSLGYRTFLGCFVGALFFEGQSKLLCWALIDGENELKAFQLSVGFWRNQQAYPQVLWGSLWQDKLWEMSGGSRLLKPIKVVSAESKLDNKEDSPLFSPKKAKVTSKDISATPAKEVSDELSHLSPEQLLAYWTLKRQEADAGILLAQSRMAQQQFKGI